MQERIFEQSRKHVFGRERRADRHHAAAERFREAEDVGRDAPLFAREHRARAAHARLHFVEDQERAELVAERADGGEILVVRNDHAALALDRLEQHGADVLARRAARGHRVDERENIVERHVFEAGQERAERHAERGLTARGERTVTLAVKAARRDDDRRFRVIVGAREFERGFDRLRSAVAEERVLQIARRQHGERFREHGAQWIEQILTVQRLALELRAHRIDDLRMAVTDVEDSEAAEAVDVFAAVDVREYVAAIGPLDGSVERALRAGLAIFEKSGVHVIAKTFDGFANDPIGLRAIDRGGLDEV